MVKLDKVLIFCIKVKYQDNVGVYSNFTKMTNKDEFNLMQFNEELYRKSQKFRIAYPDIVNTGIDIHDYLLSLFNETFNDHHHDGILRLLNSFRRNFLLASFLFESEQGNVGIQSMRTMIESGEILCAYLINPHIVHDLIIKSKGKLILNQLLKVTLTGIKSLEDKAILEIVNNIKSTKETLNNLLTHANPSYNLVYASGMEKSEDGSIIAGCFDSNKEQALSNYLLLLAVFHDFVILITKLALQPKSIKYTLKKSEEIPNFKLDLLIKKYMPHWK